MDPISATVVGGMSFAALGYFLFSRKRKSLEKADIPKFTLESVQKNPKTQKLFLEWMDKEGFTVFGLDEEIQQQVELYWGLSKKFFELSLEEKVKYKGVPKYPDEIFDKKRQVNKGFLTLNEKEFLKLCLDDPTQTLPEDIEGFAEAFGNLCLSLEIFTMSLYTIMASSIDQKNKEPLHDAKAMATITDVLRQGSSVSMIDYKPIMAQEVEEKEGRDIPTEETHFPSSQHFDTGLLTLIICSDVPALQIMDRVTGKWFMPEKICTPKKDCFVIIGRKMNRFAEFNNENSNKFLPTLHRVALPFKTSRNSLLYFQDIPS